MATEAKLCALEDELKALKQRTPLFIGALQFPGSTPSATFSGTLDNSGMNLVVLRLACKFQRSDGISQAPLVDFAFKSTVSPTYVEYMASVGVTITGNDPNVSQDFAVKGYEAETGEDYVIYYIDVYNSVWPAVLTGTFLATVQAISTAPGTLTITRLI